MQIDNCYTVRNGKSRRLPEQIIVFRIAMFELPASFCLHPVLIRRKNLREWPPRTRWKTTLAMLLCKSSMIHFCYLSPLKRGYPPKSEFEKERKIKIKQKKSKSLLALVMMFDPRSYFPQDRQHHISERSQITDITLWCKWIYREMSHLWMDWTPMLDFR